MPHTLPQPCAPLLIDSSRKADARDLPPLVLKNRTLSPVPQSGETGPIYVNRIVLNRNALLTTDTELKLIAAAAIIGFRRR